MQINRDSSNCFRCVVYVFSNRCVPSSNRESPLQRHSMISKWICISEMCIYVYLCIFIYLYMRINRWLYVCVFGLNQNEYKIKQFYELLSMRIMWHNVSIDSFCCTLLKPCWLIYSSAAMIRGMVGGFNFNGKTYQQVLCGLYNEASLCKPHTVCAWVLTWGILVFKLGFYQNSKQKALCKTFPGSAAGCKAS